jgi:hypothetical protein
MFVLLNHISTGPFINTLLKAAAIIIVCIALYVSPVLAEDTYGSETLRSLVPRNPFSIPTKQDLWRRCSVKPSCKMR